MAAKANVQVVRTVAELRDAVRAYRKAGDSIALVPTMGALHRGHLALVDYAHQRCRRAVVSIFVNPTQFAPHEDLSRYPRDEAGDLAKLASVTADLVWAPNVEEMYPEGFATHICPTGAARGLEGDIRPHHFGGVATVCCKLFSQVTPDIAIFGEKDFQQLCVLKQMVRDLNLPLVIEGAPTIRESDGLALSSRNVYLTPHERAVAPVLFKSISDVAEAVRSGIGPAAAIETAVSAILAAGFARVDYVAVKDAETLSHYDGTAGRPGRVLVAAVIGKTRLIDNVPI